MTRNNIKENTNQSTDLRNNRSDERDSKLEVTLPDGTKLTRRPKEELGRLKGKLALPEKQGFERRWVKNETQSNLQHYIDLGWIPATDNNGTPYEPIKGGLRKNGTEYKLYPLEIPTKQLERLKKINADIDSPEKVARETEALLGKHDIKGFYRPEGSNRSFETNIESPVKKK